jgi:hypothetical protein
VIIRKQECPATEHDAFIADHQHTRMHVVSDLPDYRRLRNSKLVMYRLLDDVRNQWIQTHG